MSKRGLARCDASEIFAQPSQLAVPGPRVFGSSTAAISTPSQLVFHVQVMFVRYSII